MKKLLFMIAAVVAAVSAQAAYVDWQYSISDKKTGGTGIDYTTGYTAYLLTASAWDGIKDNVTAAALDGAKLDSSALYSTTGTKALDKYTTGSGPSATGTRQVEAGTGNYYVILASAAGYNVVVDNAYITAYTDQSSSGTGLTPGITIGAGSAVAVDTLPAVTPYGGVPEPTSGLLLALGGAMLALRRKRA